MPELVDLLGRRQVLQPVLTKIAHSLRPHKRRGGSGDEHLPAMATGGDPGRPMHIDTDVTLLAQVRRPRMDAHTHPNRPRGQYFECRSSRPDSAGRSREGDEERISLRVDLDALIASKRRAQDTAMLHQRPRVLLGAQVM